MTAERILKSPTDNAMASGPELMVENAGNAKKQSIAGLCPVLGVVFGGLLGLMIGAIAAVVNMQIMKSGLPTIVKYLLVVCTGLIALVVWFVLVIALNGGVAT